MTTQIETVFTIQTVEIFPNGQRKYLQVEAEPGWTLHDLCEDLRAGPVMVTQLHTRRTGDDGVVEVVKRRDVMISAAMIFSATVNDHKTFIDATGAETD